MKKARVLCDDHDNILGHIRIEIEPDGTVVAVIGRRDLEIRGQQIVGSGSALEPRPGRDCARCAAGDA